MFSVLAIDWGKKRCGLAFVEPKTGLILPYSQQCYTHSIWTTLQTEIITRNISWVVLGIPTNFAGGDTEVTQAVRQFAREFQSRFPKITLDCVNERGSSQTAKKQLAGAGDAHAINHLAAVDIAERWLQKNSEKVS